jgi:TonB family protein
MTSKIPNPFSTAKANDQNQNSAPGAAPANPPANAQVSQPMPSPAAGQPADTSKAAPQLISTGSLSGRETKRVTPVYPANAKSSKISGTVRVFLIIDEIGRVWITNSEGPVMLRRAAEEAAKDWTFPPQLVSGRIVRVAGYIDFDFKL